jgi:hypothetical protein
MLDGRSIPEDYFEQFSAGDQEEALTKINAAFERSREKGMTFPQVSWFDDYPIETGPDAGKRLYTFQAWKEQPRWPDYAAPAHPMLVAKS